MPSYPELKYNKNVAFGSYSVDADKSRSLFKSLSSHSGQPIIYIKEFLPLDGLNPKEFVVSEKNWHPNREGSKKLAKALYRIIQEYIETNRLAKIFENNNEL